MAANPRVYRRLTRPVSGLLSYSSLWIAADHLMLVRSTGFSERYQRFSFADVKAVVVEHSDRRMVWSFAWGGLAAIPLFIAVVALSRSETPIVSGLFLTVFLSLLAVNFALGPTCNVFLMTQLQSVQLPIRRRRKAEKFVAEMHPVITAAQADLVAPAAAPVAMDLSAAAPATSEATQGGGAAPTTAVTT
jgi:hypothetical protein